MYKCLKSKHLKTHCCTHLCCCICNTSSFTVCLCLSSDNYLCVSLSIHVRVCLWEEKCFLVQAMRHFEFFSSSISGWKSTAPTLPTIRSWFSPKVKLWSKFVFIHKQGYIISSKCPWTLTQLPISHSLSCCNTDEINAGTAGTIKL